MRKQETRIKILKTAERLFAKEGYDGVATKKIANEAGITEMTLFNHFKSKELLYKTIIKERYLSIKIELVFSKLTYVDLEKDLIIIANKIISNFNDNREILLMKLREKSSLHEDDTYDLINDPVLKQIVPIFKIYEEKQLLNISGEKAAMYFILNLKGSFHLLVLENQNQEYIMSLIKENIHIFCNGINKK